jgi:hypothetical protein
MALSKLQRRQNAMLMQMMAYVAQESESVSIPVLSSGVAYQGVDDVFGDVTTTSGSGTLYVLVDQNATRTAAQVKAGGGVDSDSVVVSATGVVQSPVLTGLTAATGYYIHFMQENTAGQSNVIDVSFSTNAALSFNASADISEAYDGAFSSLSANYTPGTGVQGVVVTIRSESSVKYALVTPPVVTFGGTAMTCLGYAWGSNQVGSGLSIQGTLVYFLATTATGSQAITVTSSAIQSTNTIQVVAHTITGGVPRSWRKYQAYYLDVPNTTTAGDYAVYNNPVTLEAEDVMFGIPSIKAHANDTFRFNAATPATASLLNADFNFNAYPTTGLNPAADVVAGTLAYRSAGFDDAKGGMALILSPRTVKGVGFNEFAPFYVFTRTNGKNTRDLVISGPVFGGTAPAAVQARVVCQDGTAVTSWAALTSPTITTTSYTGTIADVPMNDFSAVSTADQAKARYDKMYVVEVRRSDNTGQVFRSTSPFMVGVAILVHGQSNAGRLFASGADADNISNPTYVKYNTANSGAAVNDYKFLYSSNGSGIRAAAEYITTTLGYPVIATTVDQSGSLLSVLTNTAGNHVAAARQWGIDMGRIDAIVWYQGEGNSTTGNSVSPATYASALTTMCAYLKAQIGQPDDIPLIAIGLATSTDASYTNADWNATLKCLYDLPNQDSNFTFGCSAFGSTLSDAVHIDNNSIKYVGERLGRALAKKFGYAQTEARFVIASASLVNSTTTDVTLTHYLGTDFTPTSSIDGFEVSQDGSSWSSPSAAVRQSANTIRLTHSALSGGTYYLRYMYGRNPTKTNMVRDNTALSQGVPLEPTGNNIQYA